MLYVNARNVNVAYKKGLNILKHHGVRQPSRAGEVLVAPCPVTTCYRRPNERVLFDDVRDANPFFHLMESLWMLAGRNDATWLDQFVSNFSQRFAENEGLQHGAYGFRWRSHFMLDASVDDLEMGFELDQLERIITMLREDPYDRRVVLQMWDPEIDLGASSKRDLPCNLCVLPRINDGLLDITVFCRSNDAIWGAYGANAVHFSVLQEYLAARIGVGIGKYYQISNNFHAYVNIFEKKYYANLTKVPTMFYSDATIEPTRIVTNPDKFDKDLEIFFTLDTYGYPPVTNYDNKFFSNIAVPMFISYARWREGDRHAALTQLTHMPFTSDWRLACSQWYDRRIQK